MNDIEKCYNVRPTTGQVLVGGNITQSLDSEKKGEWLRSFDPCIYLYSHEEIRGATGGLAKSFLVPAL